MPSHARSLKKYLQTKYGSLIKITSCKDTRVTGGFAVVVEPSGKVLHERKTRMGGLCKIMEERQAIVDQIDAILLDR